MSRFYFKAKSGEHSFKEGETIKFVAIADGVYSESAEGDEIIYIFSNEKGTFEQYLVHSDFEWCGHFTKTRPKNPKIKLGEVCALYLLEDGIFDRGYLITNQVENVYVVLEHIKNNKYKCQLIGHNSIIEYSNFLEDGK